MKTYDGGCSDALLAGTFDMNGTVDLNINTEGCGTIDNVGPRHLFGSFGRLMRF